MRALAVVVLACIGCSGTSGDCSIDTDCRTGSVCARNSECLPADEVRAVRITWTNNGQPANDMLCARTPNFYVLFGGTQAYDTFGYEPVPCRAGLFTVDKLPRRFVSVEIGVENGISEVAAFDAQGNAAFDLVP